MGYKQMGVLIELDWRQSKTVCSQGEGKENELKPLIPPGLVKEIEGR